MPFIKSPIEAPPSPCIAAIACFSRAVASASSPPMSEASDESDASAPPPDGTPTTPVLATLSPLLGAPAFLRLHVKLKHESTALC